MQGSEVAQLQCNRKSSHLERDLAHANLPDETSAAKNCARDDDCWKKNKDFVAQRKQRADDNAGNRDSNHKRSP